MKKKLLILPVILYSIFLIICPLIYILILSFLKSDSYGGVIFTLTLENYKELFDNKCILSSDTNCAFEITIMGLSLTTDITMMFIIVPFLLCSMKHFYEKNIKKENPKSSRFIRRRKKCMCEM